MKNYSQLNWTFSTLGCPEATLDEAISLAQQNGLTRLELRTIEDRVDLPALFREHFGDPCGLRDHLKKKEIEIVALDTSLKLVGNDEESRGAFLEFVEWADAIGCPSLRIFDGGTFAPELGARDLEEAVETIAWWRTEKEKSGWQADIMVETHDCLTATKAVSQLQEAIGDPVSILWDTHHTWKKGGEDPKASWAILRPFTSHVHVKDSVSKPSARHPFTYVQLGEGEFNLEETLSLFKEAEFQGIVSIEWERKWHPYLDPMESALKRARELGWW